MRVLILINSAIGLKSFRRELLTSLREKGNDVFFCCPYNEVVEILKADGNHYIETEIDRRGQSIKRDFKLFRGYISIIKSVKPDIVLTYTIKPNLYGALACRILRVKSINTVTGLGSIYINDLPIKNIIILLNRIAFKKSQYTFFLNKDNELLYKKLRIVNNSHKTIIVRGSGVNIDEFAYNPINDKTIVFLFIGRLFRDKGIREYIEAARKIKKRHPKIIFNVVGPYDDEYYQEMVNGAVRDALITYYGFQLDVKPYIREATCVVLPSYGEGCGTVLQEGASIGRPLITCNTYGCRDNVENGYNGYLCEVADVESLVNCMEKFIQLPYKKRLEMGLNSRKRAEEEFDRKYVTEKYMKAIYSL